MHNNSDAITACELDSNSVILDEYKSGELPYGCPPLDADNAPTSIFLRLVRNNPPTSDDFVACAFEEGKCKPPKCDDCTWLACSFFSEDTPLEKLRDIAKYPKQRDKKYIAYIRVDGAECGKVKIGQDRQHISFWMRRDFAPEQSVHEVIAL